MSSSILICPHCRAVNNARAVNCLACRQALYAVSALNVVNTHPLLRQRYRILNLLGRGGMGAVYQAADIELGDRLVAVKEMSLRGLNIREEAEAVRNFKREAHMLASLQHAHLPRIYDHFLENGHWYLVMDFIDGETLEHYLQRMPGRMLPFEEVIDYGIQLCAVLDYLHMQRPPIIFRDLKPANIMRAREGKLYLIDFGIARHFKPGQVKDTTAFGSPGYAAPEQYGQTQTTPRTDIYNLGAILHQMLTGRDPAQTPFFFTPLSREMQATGIQNLLANMLSLQMQRRPFSASVVSQALQQIANHAPRSKDLMLRIEAPALSKTQHVSPSIGTLISTYTQHSDWITKVEWSPNGEQIASASSDGSVHVWNPFTTAPIAMYKQKRLKLFGESPINSISWSPTGQEIAVARDGKIVEIWNVTNSQVRFTYRKHSSSVHAIAWAPDGQKIASASGSKMHVWDAKIGKTLFTHDTVKKELQDMAWSPNSKYLALASKLQVVYIFEASTHMEFLPGTTYKNHTGIVEAVKWAPDGIRLASAADDKTIQIWNGLTGNHLLTYTAHDAIIKAIAWSPGGKNIVSAGYDGTVQLWDALSGNHLFSFQKHHGPISSVACSPDGRYIATGGADNIVHIWQSV